jgi:type VI secretion system protein VasG
MSDIEFETYAGKLNSVGYDAFLNAMRHARADGHRSVTVVHWLFYILSAQDSDISLTIKHSGLDRGRVLRDLDAAIGRMTKNATDSPHLDDDFHTLVAEAWTLSTLYFGEYQIRTGHALVTMLKNKTLRRAIMDAAPSLVALTADDVAGDAPALWKGSVETDARPLDGSGRPDPDTRGGSGDGGDTPLEKFARDLTLEAASGKMDPIVGRDDEVRQVIDVLMRRRQNNPILTGEAGVGKTAVVEAFAQKLATDDVPPALRGMKLYELDIGQMQAGASMKGEFEQRLRSLIDQVQSSPIPIILFIDEAHTLIGAGGAQGTGDAANLLKPALARGTLRTIGATTFAEYRLYFEKDPALTRRFQPIIVDEPDLETCCFMLRGILNPMENHHSVRISDEALVAAVHLSARYLPARQLPDKAVSLLDTACARVAISQSSAPARIADLRARIHAREAEISGKVAQRSLGEDGEARRTEAETELAALQTELANAQGIFDVETSKVDKVLELRTKRAEITENENKGDPSELNEIDLEIRGLIQDIESAKPEDRMVFAHVDEQAVASVISDWTGIPAGRMVTDELQAVLQLSDHLSERVIGQDHGLEAIAKRIQTSRAGLADPNKPIGVFMLCGPSGVGKTETALAIAEHLYGGEQNMISINMSEFQEAHSVSLLKGAPPGYVGYGEGGRLTEAVRRKPYSVVLLDEIEKAHPDIHELFFQVFDKGIMEDGNGRAINFKNTVMLLTSNVGTDVIMDMGAKVEGPHDLEMIDTALKPALLDVFPPALLGRIVTIPYLPLGGAVLDGITRLKLDKVVRRLHGAHGSKLTYDDQVVAHIVDQCRDPDSGGRMIDNIITNSILPDLSRALLGQLTDGDPPQDVTIGIEDGALVYGFG